MNKIERLSDSSKSLAGIYLSRHEGTGFIQVEKASK